MQVDPVVEGQEHLSPYQYGWNNPVLKSDPNGLWPGEGLWNSVKKWWNSPASSGEKTVGQGAGIVLGQPDFVPKTKGEAFLAHFGAGVQEYNKHGSFVQYRRLQFTNPSAKEVGVIKSTINAENQSISVTSAYKRPSGSVTAEQRKSVQGQPCVDCGEIASTMVADHKTPLVKEYYQTGKIDLTKMRSVDAVQPQCPTCSAKQGAEMAKYSKEMKKVNGL